MNPFAFTIRYSEDDVRQYIGKSWAVPYMFIEGSPLFKKVMLEAQNYTGLRWHLEPKVDAYRLR